jgi:hypothetical protein
MSIKIENVVLPSPAQWEAIIRGTRNAKNSWDRSDSYITRIEDPETLETADFEFFMGDDDLDLMTRLANGGPVHAKYRRTIPLWVDVTAPLYWWKEADTYKVGTTANSCSTMHKIHSRAFRLEDFSHEHLIGRALITLNRTIDDLNYYRDLYNNGGVDIDTGEYHEPKDKDIWWQMIQELPSSYNQKRTLFMPYETLVGMYKYRKNHKLDEWREFCDWIKTLPYSELITGEFENSREEF